MTRYIVSVVLAMSMANLFASAQQDEAEYIRIARISYMEGPVSFQQPSDPEWTAASINLPLRPGDRIYTGPQGRAEIQFDEGSVYRLAEDTDIQFLSLSENLVQIRILTGLSSLTVSSGTTFEMDTPAAAFIMLRRGLYRFDTGDNGDTDAIVRKGELEMVSHRYVRRIESGEKIFVSADENSMYTISRYSRLDAWDEWNDRRDASYTVNASRSYLPGDVYVGASELDRYGRWVTVESYGAAWVPFSVGVSWSPYSVGRWCYRPVWGWTWVSYEPWGWLPYHYGRWYRSPRFGWCWLPGPSFSFHFWSPGLVTFYYGPSWVSWCPLGPGDYYSINNYYYNKRLYHQHLGKLRQIHYRNPGHSINRNARGAFRTVDIEHFRNGGSRAIATRDGYRRIDKPWDRGTLVHERLTVKPTSKSFSADPDRRAVRSKLNNPRPAVVHNTPSDKGAARNGYVRISNPAVTSRAVPRLRNGSAPKSVDTVRKADTGRLRVLSNTQSRSADSAKARSAVSTSTNNQSGRRISSSNDRNDRAVVNESPRSSRSTRSSQSSRSSMPSSGNGSAVRKDSGRSSGGSDEGSVTVRSAVPRNSAGTRSGGMSGEPGRTGNGSQSTPSTRRIQSTPQKSKSPSETNAPANRSSGQPGVSRDSGSSSRTRSYSTPSSSSWTQSYSVPSSSSRTRFYSTPSTNNRTRSNSAPSTGSRTRSYSAPSSSGPSRSYSAPSSSSRTRSYSAPSSSSRSRSYSTPSSGGSSGRSASPPSSGGGNGSSGTRNARRR